MKRRSFVFICCFLFLSFVSARAQNELIQPREVRAVNGVLTDTLTMSIAPLQVQGRTIMARLYNNSSPGPTWRIHPADLMRIKLINALPPNPDQDSADQGNFPQRINTTNLHTHGLNVSPKDSSDNVLLEILPGSSFQFHFQLPDDHACGTYWYHPHHHTSTYGQVINGLAGAIIIEDEEDTAKTDPALLAIDDRVMIFSSVRIDTNTNTVPYPLRLSAATAFESMPGIDSPVLVNGMLNAKITMKGGEIQRWRFINATYEFNTELHWLKISGTDTIPMDVHEIAVDGLYFESMQTVSSTFIPTGSRSDVLVRAPDAEGTYVLQLVTKNRNLVAVEKREIIRIVVDGPAVIPPMQLPTRLPHAVPEGTIKPEEITGTREITFSISDLSGIPQDSSIITRSFTIDNTPFNHSVVNLTARVGTAEEWTIHNTSTSFHPFHIHVNEFQVIEKNGVKIDPPVWHDVLLLDTLSTYKIRMRFLDFDGKTVLHCHYLPHEDWGMMNIIEILPPVTGVTDEPWKDPMAFPNPIVGRMDRVSVRIPELLRGRTVTITLSDITGRVVSQQRLDVSTETLASVDLAAVQAGTYYLRVDDGAKFRETDMIIVVR